MCTIVRETKKKEQVVYKLCIVKDDKLYSPVTGMEIKVGDVPEMTHKQVLQNELRWLKDLDWDYVTDPNNKYYDTRHVKKLLGLPFFLL